MSAGPSDIPPEIERTLAELGLRAHRVLLISPLKERKISRCAYRVEAQDGRTVKVRQLETREEARRLFDLRAGLEEAFAPVLAQCGPVLVEEWIEGVPLSDLEAEEWAEFAGALLGRLHARPLAPGAPSTLSTRDWCHGAGSDLEILGAAGKLGSEEIAFLWSEILRRDPGAARAALIHRDFCKENMLIDTRGRLRIIDNEQFRIEPTGFDLGRTFDRWPMSHAAWTRFRRGYRSSAPAEPDANRFWKMVAAVLGARVRFQHSPERLDASLARLRRFMDGGSDPDL